MQSAMSGSSRDGLPVQLAFWGVSEDTEIRDYSLLPLGWKGMQVPAFAFVDMHTDIRA